MKKVLSVILGLSRTVVWLIMAVILLACGVLTLVYSPWSQDMMRQRLVEALNSRDDIEMRLGHLRLTFPIDIQLGDVLFAINGDTMVTARSLNADVKLLPLLKGKAEVRRLALEDGFYQLGNSDSVMWMRISAEAVDIKPVSVDLSTLDIDAQSGLIRHGSVKMVMKQDTTPSDTSASQKMRIHLAALRLEDFTFAMSMIPTIDSLGTTIADGSLRELTIDMEKQVLSMQAFKADSLSLAFLMPDAATIAANPVLPSPPSDSPPWTIGIDTIAISGSKALYTTRGTRPAPGLDFGYIAVRDMDLNIYHFYNRASEIRVPLDLHATERCGLTVDASGLFELTEDAMKLQAFRVTTAATALDLDASMAMGDLTSDPRLPLALRASGYAGFADLRTMFPGYGPYLSLFPRNGRANLDIDINGTMARLNVDRAMMAIPGCASIDAKGYVANALDPDRIAGDVTLSGKIVNINSILAGFVDPSMGIKVPPMTLAGHINYAPGHTRGDLKATTLGGRLALKADYNGHVDGYDIDLDADRFPVNAFMSDLAVGTVTARVKAKGRGFDFFDPRTHMDLDAHIDGVDYDGYMYRNIDLVAFLSDGNAKINGSVDTPDLQAAIDAEGNLSGNVFAWSGTIDGPVIDLYALKFTDAPTQMSVALDGDVMVASDLRMIDADIHVDNISYADSVADYRFTDIYARFLTNDTITSLDLTNRDLTASAYAPYYMMSLPDRFAKAIDLGMQQYTERRVDVDTLQKVLPHFFIDLHAGEDNMITDILRSSDMSFENLDLKAFNDSVLSLHSDILEFTSGATTLDTLCIDLTQLNEKMHLIAESNNRPGNLDDWAHIKADAMLNTDRIALRVTQQDVNRVVGYDLGAIAQLADSTVQARLFPLNPVIGAKKWSVNLDNHINYNLYTHQIDANLKMKGDNSTLQLYTVKPEATDSLGRPQLNDIVLKVSDIHLSDWISFNPFAPPITGNLSADAHIKWDGGSNINGNGSVSMQDFYYDRKQVSDLLLDFNVETNLAGNVRAAADLQIDGKKTMTIAGLLNDETTGSPFNLDFSVIHFPLSTVNPFLPADMAQLSGTLNGNMMISGDASHPLLNGEIDFEDAAIKATMTGTKYQFSTVKIPVVDNIVKFNDFNISGADSNALHINGTVDIAEMSSPKINLNLKAADFMLVNTKKASKGASLYGKGLIDLDASVNGNLNYMAIKANVDVLAGTNITYILSMESDALTATSDENLVKFVNLNDTAAVAAADSISETAMLMSIDARLTIQNGSTINVDLPTSARDKVQIKPQGTLNYSQSPLSDGRLTGRLNFNSGMARYTLPVVGSEKTFTLDNGSYVAFNGDMMNPVLNIKAVDNVKSNVTIEGQNSRMVNFEIALDILGTLSQMDLKFDLSTNDDITVANELQSMSAEQRANQAMNLLLYGMYTGPGSSADMNFGANPLFSFLESQLNNWAAKNIKGVDLQFGIDQFNQTTNGSTSSAMTYSYQVSKSLFNDRFKIVVGGNYTTDNNADENIAENLINDISFEYYLNEQQTMVIKIFRHMGYESILEGEITQTGVGFVYRRKMESLVKMLPKFMRPKSKKN